MDELSFDRLTKVLGIAGSRRVALRSLFAAATITPLGAEAANKDRRRSRVKPGSRTRAQAKKAPRACYAGSPCARGQGRNLSKCDLSGVVVGKCKSCNFNQANLRGADASNANLAQSNFNGACLVDANLIGANLANANFNGAVFCGTTMPDGSRNDSGCSRGTTCCPTCALPCPVDPAAGQPGFCCAGGYCSCGSVCCAGPDCFVVTTQFRGSEVRISREYCERPASCVLCGGREDQCCTACGPNEECISSGPIIGGSIRRR